MQHNRTDETLATTPENTGDKTGTRIEDALFACHNDLFTEEILRQRQGRFITGRKHPV